MASIRRRGATYQIRWRGLDGKERGWTAHTLDAARRHAREVERAHDLGREWEPQAARTRPRLAAVAEAYQDARRLRVRPHTLRMEGSHLDLLLRFAAARDLVYLDELSRAVLDDFLAWLLAPSSGRHERPRRPSSAGRTVGAALGLWRWAEDSGRYEGVPRAPHSLDLPRALPPPVVAPTFAEADACLGELAGWHRRLGVWLRWTGLRAGESMLLEWRDLDMDRGTLAIRPEIDKSARGRTVPLAEPLLAEIAGWGVREGYLIPSGRGPGLREREARGRDAARAWARAGVREAAWRSHPWHAFRRAFKSGLLGLGANPDAVDFLQGHSTGARSRYIDGWGLPLRETLALLPAVGAGNVVPIVRGQGVDR